MIVYWYGNKYLYVGALYSPRSSVSHMVFAKVATVILLFKNIYCDDLSVALCNYQVGCFSANNCIHHIFYADAPSVKGLNSLLRICEDYSIEHDIILNRMKNVTMIIRSRSLKDLHIPTFLLYGKPLTVIDQYKYPECMISNK